MEMTGDWFSFDASIGKIFEPDFNKNILAFGETNQVLASRKVGAVHRVRTADGGSVGELLVVGIFHNHS